jgi:murein DD-endopeptidase MepM/ murein hydrolase activator NlpD
MDMMRAAEPAPDPTPIFASRGKVILRLPVNMDDLTEVGFHQASYDYALAMKTPLPDADMAAAKKNQGTPRDLSAQEVGTDAVLTGSVLRMWRDRPGKPNTAVDVGAAPGSPVLAPVEGTVVLVKSYDLYGKHPDVRVHIRPDANTDIDVVLIHVQDPSVKAGDRVVAGVTQLGAVRKLSDKMRMQLTSYTKDDGDHVHIQLNDITDPAYEGLEGAVAVSGT